MEFLLVMFFILFSFAILAVLFRIIGTILFTLFSFNREVPQNPWSLTHVYKNASERDKKLWRISFYLWIIVFLMIGLISYYDI